MSLLKNKKGVTGYILISWTGIEHCGMRAFSPKVAYMVRKIEIMSCGKVQMTARYIDDGGDMAKHFFNPKTEVFATFEDAASKAPELFKSELDRVVRLNDEMLQRAIDRYNKYKNEAWRSSLERARVNHKIIADRALSFSVLSYQDYLDTRGF